jgi:hypothetical protein
MPVGEPESAGAPFLSGASVTLLGPKSDELTWKRSRDYTRAVVMPLAAARTPWNPMSGAGSVAVGAEADRHAT